ncbi:polysulfide reductase, partial [Streptomyces sp. SID1328]|nr:polysulfide reductase [Streptomyces sp. SID1328]
MRREAAMNGPAVPRASRRRRRRRGEDGQPVVPDAEFTSYYGLPVLNTPTWEALDIAGY